MDPTDFSCKKIGVHKTYQGSIAEPKGELVWRRFRASVIQDVRSAGSENGLRKARCGVAGRGQKIGIWPLGLDASCTQGGLADDPGQVGACESPTEKTPGLVKLAAGRQDAIIRKNTMGATRFVPEDPLPQLGLKG